MTKLLGLSTLALLLVCSPVGALAQAAPVPAAATAPLSSWEDGMDGWAINVENGQNMAKATCYSETGRNGRQEEPGG